MMHSAKQYVAIRRSGQFLRYPDGADTMELRRQAKIGFTRHGALNHYVKVLQCQSLMAGMGSINTSRV